MQTRNIEKIAIPTAHDRNANEKPATENEINNSPDKLKNHFPLTQEVLATV